MSTKQPALQGLSDLFTPPASQLSDADVIGPLTLVIPELGTSSAVTWSDGSACWLQTLLPEFYQGMTIKEFRHEVPAYREFTWQHLAEKGDILLEEFLKQTSVSRWKGVIFIAHGFGGLILKRALSPLFERFHEPSFRKAILSISGIIFLGCPHVTWSKTSRWDSLPLMLRACMKSGRSKTNASWGDASPVVSISQKFADMQTEIPILSIFEQKVTRIGGSLFSGRIEIIVDKSFAEIGVKNEVLLGADAAHLEICHLNRTQRHCQDIERFFTSNFQNSADILMMETSYKPGPTEIWNESEGQVTDPNKVRVKNQHEFLVPSPANATGASSDIAGYEIIPSKPVSYNSRKIARLPCFLLKPHVQDPNFVGRSVVFDALDDALLPRPDQKESASPRTFAMCGMGGVGKTQTSVEYAYMRQSDFDAIFFVNASDSAKIALGFIQMSHELGLEEKDSGSDQVVSRDLVLEWLSRPLFQSEKRVTETDQDDLQEAKWLLVFDNADELELLKDYWPVSGTGSILVTSRDPLAKTQSHVRSPNGMDLDCLSVEESTSMLKALTNYTNIEDSDLATEVAQRLGGLPLAITFVASTILRRSLSFEEFLHFWEQDSVRLSLYRKIDTDQPKNLYTTWAFEDLTAQGLCLIDLLSFIDPDRVHETIFDLSQAPGSLDRGISADYPSSPLAYIDARAELIKSSLIRRNIKLKELSTHRLIQDAARARMTPQRRNCIIQLAIDILFNAWPFGIFDYSTARWKTCEIIFPHVRVIMAHLRDSTSIELGGMRTKVSQLLTDAGWYYLERGNIIESIPFQETAQQLLEPSNPSHLIILSDVHLCQAEAYIYTSNAEKGLIHAVETLKLLESHEDPGYRLPQAYNEMAEALLHLSRYDEAITYAEKAASAYFALNDPENYPFFSLYMKAFCRWRQGSNDDAAVILENLLAWRENYFGPQDTESFKTGLAMLTLGNVKESQGKLEEAMELHLRAYHQYTTTLGVSHYRFAALSTKLGIHYARLGKLGDARTMFEQAIKIYGDRSYYVIEIADVRFKLSHVLSLLGSDVDYNQSRDHASATLRTINKDRLTMVEEKDLEHLIAPWSL